VADDDGEVICQRSMDAVPCHDHRLGRALDTLWPAGLARLYGAVCSQALSRSALDLARRHIAATSLKLDGAYARDKDEEGPHPVGLPSRSPAGPQATALGAHGDGRGVPVWGHVTAGPQRDRTAPRCHLTPRRQHRPDLGAPHLVADSQVCAGETMALAAHRFGCVTLVPQTVGLRQALVDAPELRARPRLWARPGRRHGEMAHERGASVLRPDRWQTTAGEVQELPRRWLVVESTPLAKAKAPRWAAAQQTVGRRLAERQRQWQRRPFACETDAHQATTWCRRGLHLPPST
jgi:hypothetical protein